MQPSWLRHFHSCRGWKHETTYARGWGHARSHASYRKRLCLDAESSAGTAHARQHRDGALLPSCACLPPPRVRRLWQMRLRRVRTPVVHLQHQMHNLRHLWRGRLLRRLRLRRWLRRRLLRPCLLWPVPWLRLRILRRRLEHLRLAVLTHEFIAAPCPCESVGENTRRLQYAERSHCASGDPFNPLF